MDLTPEIRGPFGLVPRRRTERTALRTSIAFAALFFTGLAPGSSIAWAAASSWQSNEHGAVRLIAEAAVAPGGAPPRLGVEFRTAPGWHVYWKNPGDAGFPPRIDLLAPPDLRGETIISFPSPRRFSLPGGLFAIGYEGSIVYPFRPLSARSLSVPPGTASVRVEADVDYLTCAVDCVPYRYRLALDLPVGSAARDPEAGVLLDRAEATLPLRASDLPEVEIRTEPLGQPPNAIAVEIDGVEPSSGSDLFVEPQDRFEIGRPSLQRTAKGVRFHLSLVPRRTDVAISGPPNLAWTAVGLMRAGRALAIEARSGPEKAEEKGADRSTRAAESGESPFVPSRLPWLSALLVATAAVLVAAAMLLWRRRTSGVASGLLGFLALGLLVGCLHLLATRLSATALASLELALLGLSLVLWLRLRVS